MTEQSQPIVRVRRTIHRGVVEAAALWIDVARVGEAEARRRVLAAWSGGAPLEVRRVAGGLLVRLARARRVATWEAPGTPLVSLGGALAAAPLDADELDALAPAAGDVVLVTGGGAHLAPIGPPVDVAAWIDVGEVAIAEVASLGEPPARAEPVALARVDRASFGDGVPAADPAAEAVRAALAASGLATAGEARAPRSRGLGALLARALAQLASWLVPRATAGAATAAGTTTARTTALARRTIASSPHVAASARPSWRERLRRRLEDLAARLLLASRLGALVGKRHADYLAKLLDLFARGDLDAALRHAIPLGGEPSTEAGPLRLSPPRPRDELAISVGPRTQPASALGLGPSLYDELSERYRRAAERLEREGRIEEAAFVLAELLHADAEAVALLEKHRRWALAARVAEDRGLAPAQVVRLWFRAGDRARAVDIARARGAFADAVTRLEREDPDAATSLRLLWAESLAEAGDFAGAVRVAWLVREAHGLVRAWIDRALALGGAAAASLLPRKLLLDPAEAPALLARARELLDDEGADAAPARARLAEALLQLLPRHSTSALCTLARPTVRALVRDRHAHGLGERIPRKELERLATLSGDDALAADLPADRARPTREARTHIVTVEAHDTGTLAIRDAALLPDGRTLVALGELGVRLLTRDGRTVVHFDQPAERLVISDGGDRAIAMARRGPAWRLARIDVAGRRAAPWCDAIFDGAAPDFDGNLLFVSDGGAVLAIDAISDRWKALWRVATGATRVRGIARSPAWLRFLAETPGEGGGRAAWSYELPSLALRSRALLDAGNGLGLLAAEACATDGTVGVVAASHPDRLLLFDADSGKPRETLVLGALDGLGPPTALALSAGWIATVASSARLSLVELYLRRAPEGRVLFALEGTRSPSLRLVDERLTIADERGRLIGYDLARALQLRDLRL